MATQTWPYLRRTANSMCRSLGTTATNVYVNRTQIAVATRRDFHLDALVAAEGLKRGHSRELLSERNIIPNIEAAPSRVKAVPSSDRW